jgi:SAM-dependent methyltransferase
MAIGDNLFVAKVADLYDAILGPFMFEPLARNTAERFAGFEGDLLEVAAGTGILTRELDRLAGRGCQITATDLNAPMLDVAAGRLASPRVAWRQADALALPFDAGRFDAVVCQFGVMFYPDRVAGHAEALRVLRPSGQYVVAVWGALAHNLVAETVHDAVVALFPRDPPGFLARTPHGFHDLAALRADLAAAGFGSLSAQTVTLPAGRLAAGELAVGYCQGTPLRNEIEARDSAGLGAVTAAVEQALRTRFGEGPIDSTLQAHVVVACP